MGATFPIVTKILLTDIRKISTCVSRLYFANILGAVSGSFLVAFVLIEAFGVSTTQNIAASINFTIASVAFTLLKLNNHYSFKEETISKIPLPQKVQTKAFGRLPEPNNKTLLMTALFLSGFSTMAYQVIWTRTLVVYFSSTIYSFAVILLVFLFALAAGSLVAGRILEWGKSDESFVAVIQVLMGSSAALGIQMSNNVYSWINKLYPLTETWFEIVSFNFLISFLLIFPSIFIAGMMIPVMSKILVQKIGHVGHRLGDIYFINTLGAMIGPLAAAFFLIPFVGIKNGFKLLALFQIIMGAVLLYRTPEKSNLRKFGYVATAISLILVPLIPTKILTDQVGKGNLASTLSTLNTDFYDLLYYKEGNSSTVSVIQNKNDGTKQLEINGFSSAGTDQGFGYMKMMGHLPLFLHAQPEKVLIIGLGTGITAGSMLLHPIKKTRIAEIDSAVITALNYFEEENHALLEDPRVKIIHEDGRNYLTTTTERYDVITLEPFPPYFSGMVNLYSTEFYKIAKNKLNSEGIICQWLPLHVVSPELLKMMVKSFNESFEEMLIWIQPNSHMAFMVGSDKKMSIHTTKFDLAMKNSEIRSDLNDLGVTSQFDIINNFVMNGSLVNQYVSEAKPITDDYPYLEFAGPRVMKYGIAKELGEVNVFQINHYRESMVPEMIAKDGKLMISFP